MRRAFLGPRAASSLLVVTLVLLLATLAGAFSGSGQQFGLTYEFGDAGGKATTAETEVTFLSTSGPVGLFANAISNLWAGPQCIFNSAPVIRSVSINITAANDTTVIGISGVVNDTDATPVRIVVFRHDNVSIACLGSNVTDGSSNCALSAAATGCPEGTCTLRVYAQEPLPGVCNGIDFSASYLSVSFIYDITVPSIPEVIPNTAAIGYGMNGTLFTVRFNYTEANPANFTLTIFNSTLTVCTADNSSSIPAGTNQQANVTCLVPAVTRDGFFTVRVTLYDLVGQLISNTQVDALQIDTVPPTVTNFTFQATVTTGGRSYAKLTIPINVTTADNVNGSGIRNVEFYANSTLIGNDTSAPYSVLWDTTTIPDGGYNITARIRDRAGHLVVVG